MNKIFSTIRVTELSLLQAAVSVFGIIAATIAMLKGMGRIWYCSCGYIKFWQGETWSSENSQHLTDWYTFSHLIHGFIFYWLTQKFLPRWSVGSRFAVAILVECVWEIIENSPIIINRYRSTTISLDYYGDSILNSSVDIVASIVGFWLARKFPIWLSITVIIVMELGVGYMIKDNLLLNIIMLIYPVGVIKSWQMQ